MKRKFPVLPILIGGIAMSLATIAVFSIQAATAEPKRSPHYLLSGTLADTSDTYYNYYDIGNNEYAIALKEVDGNSSSIRETYDSTITIPATHKGKKVTGIWHNAFQNCPATTVTFAPNSNITVIDYEAFFCSGITSIEIPYTIKSIGDAAFYKCADLTKVTIVNSADESTGSALTCFCETPDTPDPTPEPEPDPESSSSNPESSSVEESSSDEESSSGDDSSSSAEPEDPNACHLKLIPSYCFYRCESLAELSLPSLIEEIGEEAFSGCSALRSDLFFTRIKAIRNRAFQYCTLLREVYISKSLFEDANGDGIEPHAFNYCDPTLNIYFCGSEEKVNAWVTNHQRWGWHTDNTNPDAMSNSKKINSYDYILKTGDNYFTTDWTYSVDETTKEVTLTHYNGAAPTSSKSGGFISVPSKMPYPVGNKVTRLATNVFEDNVKSAIRRLYLPTTLKSIDNLMFRNGYNKLHVIDDNGACETDKLAADSSGNLAVGRIDLSGLTDLEFIGTRAFVGMGGDKVNNVMLRNRIQSLHLPSGLVAIGDEAFGIFSQRLLPNVKEFIWDYDEDNAKLETVGCDAFYALGYSSGSGEITGNETRRDHTASTIIFPKTFKYFGLLDADVNRYKSPAANAKYSAFDFSIATETGSRKDRPAHAFAGCSLIKKVIFKGSDQDYDPEAGVDESTTDLIIPLQTFVYNESLETIVFEERCGHHILFHTQHGSKSEAIFHWAQESIGGNSGRGKNDFRGEPFLQTLVLPTKYTQIHVQNFAFHANARAAIYLSGTLSENVYSDNTSHYWINNVGTWGTNPIGDAVQWKTIGDESFYSSEKSPGYYGYCFAPTWNTNKTSDKSINTFGINQEIPVYENVHYKDEETGAEVGSTNTKHFVKSNHCAFVCDQSTRKATMTKYLYNLYDTTITDQTTAKVPEQVYVSGDATPYTVTKIGESAFSACYCDGNDTSPKKAVGSFDDLNTIVLPNGIKEIGDYAFIRAYGVTAIKSYTGNGTPVEAMPSSLEKIGKNAFIFSSVTKILGIPYTCLFYENYETTKDVTKVTSVFANSVSLRQITFRNASGDLLDANDKPFTSSKYYSTTTYEHATGVNYTCALYSTNDSGVLVNKNRLLLVLNRDSADNLKTNNTDYLTVTGHTSPVFKGLYKSNPYLFGAFKMGYYIQELECGVATKDGGNPASTYAQPLFSPVATKSGSELLQKVMYLGVAEYTYNSLNPDITTISGNVFDLPEYAMTGCENLNTINLPYRDNGEIPAGVFKDVSSTSTQYNTLDNTGAVIHDDANTLNLQGSGYKTLGQESFANNNSIHTFICSEKSGFKVGVSAFQACANLTTVSAPTGSSNMYLDTSAFKSCTSLTSVDFSKVTGNLTLNTSAFEGCSSLTTIDLSGVTGTLKIKKNAFASCTSLTTIIWPTNATSIEIEDEGAFSGCTGLINFTLPTQLSSKLGNKTFYGCTNLESVTSTGNLTNLTSIGVSAFENCSSLENLDFAHMTALTTINKNAFKGAGKLSATGEITIPNTVTTIDAAAFQNSKIVIVNFSTDSAKNLMLGNKVGKESVDNAYVFDSCSELVAVRFLDDNYTLLEGNQSEKYNGPQFSNCPKLKYVILPSTFNENNKNGVSQFQGSNNVESIFLRKKYNGGTSRADWHKVNNVTLPLTYYLETLGEFTPYDVSGSSLIAEASRHYFWTYVSGDLVNLGRATAYDSATTTVTFANAKINGVAGTVTLDSTGFHLPS